MQNYWKILTENSKKQQQNLRFYQFIKKLIRKISVIFSGKYVFRNNEINSRVQILSFFLYERNVSFSYSAIHLFT